MLSIGKNTTPVTIGKNLLQGLLIVLLHLRNLRCSNKIPIRSTHLEFHCPLCRFTLIHLGCCGLSGCWDRGHLGFAKNSGKKGSKESGMPSIGKNTTPVTIGKNLLQGLLIVLLHCYFILTRLRLKRRHFIFSCPNLQLK